MTDIPEQRIPELMPGERARLTLPASTALDGSVAECTLLVIHRGNDGCVIYGVPTTGREVSLSRMSMVLLARLLLRYAEVFE